jgi:hypothetical protein
MSRRRSQSRQRMYGSRWSTPRPRLGGLPEAVSIAKAVLHGKEGQVC